MPDFGLNLVFRILRIEPIFRILRIITLFSTQKRHFITKIALFTRPAEYAALPARGMQKQANRHATAIQPVRSCHAEWVRNCCGMSAQSVRNWSGTGAEQGSNREAFDTETPTKTPPTATQNHLNHLSNHHLPPLAPRVADGWLMAAAVRLFAGPGQLMAANRRLLAADRHPMGGMANFQTWNAFKSMKKDQMTLYCESYFHFTPCGAHAC